MDTAIAKDTSNDSKQTNKHMTKITIELTGPRASGKLKLSQEIRARLLSEGFTFENVSEDAHMIELSPLSSKDAVKALAQVKAVASSNTSVTVTIDCKC